MTGTSTLQSISSPRAGTSASSRRKSPPFEEDVNGPSGSAAQPVEQVDAGDQSLELAAVHDDRHHAAVENLHQLLHGGIDRHSDQMALHRGGDRLTEVLRVVEHFDEDVLLVDDAHDAAVL